MRTSEIRLREILKNPDAILMDLSACELWDLAKDLQDAQEEIACLVGTARPKTVEPVPDVPYSSLRERIVAESGLARNPGESFQQFFKRFLRELGDEPLFFLLKEGEDVIVPPRAPDDIDEPPPPLTFS